MSRTFSINNGSFDSLNVSLRCGARANARQIRLTLLRLNPHAFAIERVLQCVASRGVFSNVIVNTRSTSRSFSRRFVPGRGSSNNPSNRFAMNRRRHFPTVCACTPNSSATSWLFFPTAHPSTIRERCASAWLDLGRFAHCSSRSRSSSVMINSAFGRPVRIASLPCIPEYEWDFYLCYVLQRRDTSSDCSGCSDFLRSRFQATPACPRSEPP